MISQDRNIDEAAYITIVEGPPPDFRHVNHYWTASLSEGPDWSVVASCEMRTLNGPSLVDRCRNAWQEGRPARLDYPLQRSALAMSAYAPKSGRVEVEIVAARWRYVEEGQVLTLWVRTDRIEDIETDRREE